MNTNVSDLPHVVQANKLARMLQLPIIIALTLSYVTQGIKNGFSVLTLVAIIVMLWGPVVAAAVLYKKKPDSQIIKHIIGIGYGCFYVFICITSEQRLVYTYAFPMLLIVTIYCDFKYSMIVASACSTIAVIHAFAFTVNTGFTPQNIAAMEIEIASSVLVGVYSVLANRFIIRMNNRNLKASQDAEKQTEDVLSRVMEVSNHLVDEVQLVSDKMEILSSSSSETLGLMTEVQRGTGESADSVQQQLLKTEEIQSQIDQVTVASQNIEDSVNDSTTAIGEGRNNVRQLISYAENSEVAGNKASEQLNSLKGYTEQMESIVSLIQGVAKKTNLLSLNASIEAARAGEAGRGFAVVAGEISNLAAQTQTATEDINNLIGNVTNEVDGVAKAITVLVESNQVQTESARVTAGSFEKIASSTENIKVNSNDLAGIVERLDVANKQIVDNIQTVSAITQEVTAHATTTCAKTEETENIVSEVKSVVVQMTKNAEILKQL